MNSFVTKFLFLFIITSVFIFSQWSNNPSTNLQVCDLSNDQELPKIANTSNGGTYN